MGIIKTVRNNTAKYNKINQCKFRHELPPKSLS
jgi:hypothetical protein